MRRDNPSMDAGVSHVPFSFAAGTTVLPSRNVQHAWYELTRARPWRSVALVPVEEGCSTLELAYDLAQMASLDPRYRVLVINASGQMADPRSFGNAPPNSQEFSASGALPAAQGKFWILDCAKMGLDDAAVGMVEVPKHVNEMRAGSGPYTMIIVATSAPLTRPSGVSAARSVDTVVLCPSLGLTSFNDARRTIELVGEDSIAGTIALRKRH